MEALLSAVPTRKEIMLKQEFYCNFAQSDYETELQNIAKNYIAEIESYDRRICSGIDRRGDAMPIGSWEYGRISVNAQETKKKYLIKYFGGVRNQDFNRAIRDCR